MKCPNCNFEYKSGEKICKACGKELSSDQNTVVNIFLLLFFVVMALFKYSTFLSGENLVKCKEIIQNKIAKTKPTESKVSEVIDWGLYMGNLERNIKRNWNPPSDNKSNRIVVNFLIAKDGSLISRKIIQSSRNLKADKAALQAIDKTAPFEPLPPQFKGTHVPVEFTFDYNVHNFK